MMNKSILILSGVVFFASFAMGQRYDSPQDQILLSGGLRDRIVEGCTREMMKQFNFNKINVRSDLLHFGDGPSLRRDGHSIVYSGTADVSWQVIDFNCVYDSVTHWISVEIQPR